MAIVLKKNTVDISSSVQMESLDGSWVLTKEVGRLNFTIRNYSGKATCALGDTIDLYEGATHLFGGTITEIENINEGGKLISTLYKCTDWSFRLNSQLVVNTYTDMDPKDIVEDIIDTFTDGTYTTNNVVMGNFNVSTIKFNYEQVTISLERLANQIGWEWFVDADKDVHFFPPDTVVSAPFDIDDTSGNLEWASLDINQDITNMKNSVYVIGGLYSKVYDATTTPDKYLTDGTKSVFPLAYTYDPSTIIVTLAGVAQSVGTDQVTDPTSVQVLYNNDGRFVRFTTVPTTGQTVKIYGNAQIPILAHVQNQVAISLYGEIQDVIFDQQIESFEEAQERASAQVAKYGSPVYAARFATLKTGLVVGQTIRVNSVIFGTDVLMVVKRISGKLYSPTQMRYEVECVGTESVNFIDIMKLLLTQANASTVISDSTVLQVLLSFNESLVLADTLNTPTATAGPYKYGSDANAGVYNFSTYS